MRRDNPSCRPVSRGRKARKYQFFFVLERLLPRNSYFCIGTDNEGKGMGGRSACCALPVRGPHELSYNEDAMNETFNKIEYVVCCVGAFAERFGLTNAQAYAYLRRFGGIDFLIDCYAAEHTLSVDDAVEDLTNICLKNGGKLA